MRHYVWFSKWRCFGIRSFNSIVEKKTKCNQVKLFLVQVSFIDTGVLGPLFYTSSSHFRSQPEHPEQPNVVSLRHFPNKIEKFLNSSRSRTLSPPMPCTPGPQANCELRRHWGSHHLISDKSGTTCPSTVACFPGGQAGRSASAVHYTIVNATLLGEDQQHTIRIRPCIHVMDGISSLIEGISASIITVSVRHSMKVLLQFFVLQFIGQHQTATYPNPTNSTRYITARRAKASSRCCRPLLYR